MTTLIADVETDGLLKEVPGKAKEMTRLWMIQLGDSDTDEVTIYADQPGFPPLKEAIARLKAADKYVFHNGLSFDLHAINRIYPGTIEVDKMIDTLVVGRLLFPQYKTHSLADWGARMECAKGDYTGDFQSFTPEMVVYGRQDIVVTRKLWHRLKPKLDKWDWSKALEIEHKFQYVIGLQEQNGFTLDRPKAIALESELRQELADISVELQRIFPERIVPAHKTAKKSYRPNRKKVTTWLGVKKRLDNPWLWDEFKGMGAVEIPFTAVALETFNPSSRQQVAQRLIDKYNWQPSKFTDAGTVSVDEEVLSELPYPEAKVMLRYLVVEKMLSQIISKGGDKGWLIAVNDKTSRVHGRVNTIGTATGRCSHFTPNMAQVSKKDIRMRQVWVPRKGWKLVGIDADGLEFVALAHYITRLDGGITRQRLLEGDKKKGTDVHSANRDAILAALRTTCSFPDPQEKVLADLRDAAKTLIYALMYGASDPRLGLTMIEILRSLGVNRNPKSQKALGTLAKAALGKGIPGLDKLIDDVKAAAKKKGYIKGIDGRKIFIRSDHSAFNFLLQSCGAIVMKVALNIFHFEKVPANGWVHGEDFDYCANVHDEAQIEAKPEIAQAIGDAFAQSITEAAEWLGFRCPLSGSAAVGDNWGDTH